MGLLRKAVEERKRHYIQKLLAAGLYQTDVHLYEMTLTELEQIYYVCCGDNTGG
ncbi:Fur-regulated basic protein FbpA [Ectobacillus ponti]|uniref:Fur-regulated basic protein FbpA n=1 Tax=Ectobacillus ponti TaxID=2961894 RepID=A0AA41X541_9BACI|nr:Fur-regulated basic protein FbpA [Ectobacillus ponti]MCP8967353.1 Fur-regulated basic protein FbpA [Ectobacillus ponti]